MQSKQTINDETAEIVSAAIAQRRSFGVARLKPDAVDAARVQRTLEAADWAASHGDTEPWRFVVYAGDARNALGEAFAAAYREDAERDGDFQEHVYESQKRRADGAPVWISLGMEPALKSDGTLRMGETEELLAMGGAVQNLHVTACAQGLAGMWLSKGVMVHPRVAEWVGLTAPHARLLGFFVLGWPAIDWPTGERRPLIEKVRWAEPSVKLDS